ncbi:hypothetical protein ABK040_016116 [Willaertia magna]
MNNNMKRNSIQQLRILQEKIKNNKLSHSQIKELIFNENISTFNAYHSFYKYYKKQRDTNTLFEILIWLSQKSIIDGDMGMLKTISESARLIIKKLKYSQINILNNNDKKQLQQPQLQPQLQHNNDKKQIQQPLQQEQLNEFIYNICYLPSNVEVGWEIFNIFLERFQLQPTNEVMTQLLKGFANKGDFKMVLKIINTMELNYKLIPSLNDISLSLKATIKAKAFDKSKKIFNDLLENEIEINEEVFVDYLNSEIDNDFKNKIINLIKEIKSINLLNALIKYYGIIKNEKAIHLYNEWIKKGKYFNIETINNILFVCLKLLNLNEAKKIIFNDMKKLNIVPQIPQHNFIVHILAKKGLFNEVEDYILENIKQPSNTTFLIVMFYCQERNESVERMERLFKRTLEIRPNAHAFEMMINCYRKNKMEEKVRETIALKESLGVVLNPHENFMYLDK